MPTIKLNPNGKIITKDGKVSCECCEAGECCMYPAQALFDGLYTVDDLPDTVVITYTEAQSPFTTFGPYVLTRTGSNFFGGPDNEVGIGLSTTGELWTIEDGSGGIGSFPCLINEESPGSPFVVTIEDQFADTYTVAYEGDSAQVTRVSLCVWTGTTQSEGTTVLWRLEYSSINDPEAPAYLKWVASIQGLTTVAGIKSPFQNTPVGAYGSGITVS
jgi:hypothetical protein